jgi:hypothetical protein
MKRVSCKSDVYCYLWRTMRSAHQRPFTSLGISVMRIWSNSALDIAGREDYKPVTYALILKSKASRRLLSPTLAYPPRGAIQGSPKWLQTLVHASAKRPQELNILIATPRQGNSLS